MESSELWFRCSLEKVGNIPSSGECVDASMGESNAMAGSHNRGSQLEGEGGRRRECGDWTRLSGGGCSWRCMP